MTSMWACQKCNRRFTRKNQRHACGTGNRADVLRKRPPEVVKLYAALEKFVKSNALRLAIHLSRKAEHNLFIKVGSDRKHVTHVAKLRAMEEPESMQPFLREAYEHSMS